ncbi:unnamed protein product [Rotaria sp. Silwood1]|nr:unnamed protein product [Rotaria sp. Silwood1]CAF1588567.1 unnamed protein product [Rotaria sp. Silwood1]
MPHCLILGILSTQRLITNETNLNDVETTPNTIVDLISSLQILIKLYGSFIYLSDLFPLSQLLSNLYDLCDEYFRTCFDEDDLMISLISYNLCKFDILLEQTIKEYNKLYIRLIEHNFKLTKIHVYT